MSVRTKDLTYSVNDTWGGRIHVLQPTSVCIPPHSVTAIMGPSGAGKTTLMDLLSGTKTSGFTSGDIYIAGKPVKSELKSLVAHVECFDFHIEEFTVLENLYYTAMLRVGRQMSHEECMTLCQEIADTMNLTHILDVYVGSELKKGISGGQKKLLSIANELLSFPTVICLDEPTSGLDSTTSLQLARVLQDLAGNHNKTVIATVHQPSVDMLSAWHHLVLIGKGSIVYDGPISGLDSYLMQVGYTVPDAGHKIDTVEFAVHLMSNNNDVAHLVEAWNKRSLENTCENSVIDENSDFDIERRKSLPLLSQIWVLTCRHGLYTARTLHGVRGMFARNLLGGLFYGIIYYRNGDKLAELDSFVYPSKEGITLSPYVYNNVTLCFAVPLFIVVINMVPIPSMYAMSRYCNKEQANKLYSSFARWLALLLVDVPTLYLGTCCFIVLMFYMSGIHQEWFRFAYMVMFGSLLGYAQAQLCAHISFSAIQGFVLMAILCCAQLVFSGYFVEKSDLPEWLRWAVYASFMRWCTGQLMMNEFEDIMRHQGNIVLEIFEYDNFEFHRSAWVVAVYFIGLELLILISLYAPKPVVTHELNSPAANYTKAVNPLNSSKQILSPDSCTASHALTEDFKDENNTNTVDEFDLEKDDLFSPATPFPTSRMVNFLFQNVTYTLPGDFLERKEGKQLLKGVDGTVNSGEMCAVMGVSGSGKTTLLNVLAGRTNVGIVGGAIQVNGSLFPGMKIANSVASEASPTFAYVLQEDAHFPLFTVKETLEFAAMLRQRTACTASIGDMVEETLHVLGLAHIAHHQVGVIGDSMISRGQLRRLTIGVEIVNSPSMVFLDEPTTGLDSFLARTVVRGLKTLATSGRTLICTIHSPSPYLFEQFDKLLLLSEGHVLYFGPACSCENYLRSCGFTGVSTNTADFIIHAAMETRDGMASSSCRHSLNHLASMARKQFYSSNTIRPNPGGEVELVSLIPEVSRKSKRAMWAVMVDVILENILADFEDVKKSPITIRVLLERELLKEIRRYKFWITTFLRAVLLGCLLGYVWGDLTPDGSVLDYTGLSLVVYITTNLWMVEIVPMWQDDKVIFYRERDANATSTFSSWVVSGFSTSIALAIMVLAVLVPVYTISDMRHGTKYFLEFYAVTYLQLIANLHLGVFVSTFTPNTMVNVLIFPSLTLTMQSMLCGYAAMISTFKLWYRWMTYVIPAKWYMGIMFISQLKGDDHIAADFESLLSDYGWDYPLYRQFVFLLLILGTHKFLVYIGMRFLTSAKQ